MKKGFTLIELLAVIVILAIIALIATPIVLGIINEARDNSRKRTLELIGTESQLAYANYLTLNGGQEPEDFCTIMGDEYFAMEHAKVTGCSDENAIVSVSNIDYEVNCDLNSLKVTHDKYEYKTVLRTLR